MEDILQPTPNKRKGVFIWIFLLIIVLVAIFFLYNYFKSDYQLYQINEDGTKALSSEVYLSESDKATSAEESELDIVNVQIIQYLKCTLDNIDDINIAQSCQYFMNADSLRKFYANDTFSQKYPRKMIFNFEFEGKDNKEEIKKDIENLLEAYSKIYNVKIISYSLKDFAKVDIAINDLSCQENISFVVVNRGKMPVDLQLNAEYHNIAGEAVGSALVNNPFFILEGETTKAFSFEKELFYLGDIDRISDKGIEGIRVVAYINSTKSASGRESFEFKKDCI